MPEGGGGTGQGISGNKEETITGGKNAGWYMKEGGKGVRLRDDIRERPENQSRLREVQRSVWAKQVCFHRR